MILIVVITKCNNHSAWSLLIHINLFLLVFSGFEWGVMLFMIVCHYSFVVSTSNMKTLSSPLPIPADHNPFDFYSHRGDKQQGLERQESKQPTTRSVKDYKRETETKTKT